MSKRFQNIPLFFYPILVLAIFWALAFNTSIPETPEALGERLFFDPLLSKDTTISCSSCHIPAFAFSDTATFSRGVGGKLGKRNSPGITNMSSRPYFFYDGRAATLEDQILMPIADPLEMAFSASGVVERLRNDPTYKSAFKKIYGRKPDTTALANAIAAYIRTLETSNTPFDRWMMDKPNPMSESAVRGRRIFMNKGKCFDCHFSPDFTGDEFRNIGLYNGTPGLNDVGRFKISGDSLDLGKLKVPGLRNVAHTAPYMHNGIFKTLEEVIDYYDNPSLLVTGSINRDTLFNKPLQLTHSEKSDLKAFLEALTDDRF